VAVVHEFPNNVILDPLMKVNMAKASPKVDELRKMVDGKGGIQLYLIYPCAQMDGIKDRPILSCIGFKDLGGNVFWLQAIEPRSVPKGRRVAIPNGDGSGGIKKLSACCVVNDQPVGNPKRKV
jgi:hypothetical protein